MLWSLGSSPRSKSSANVSITIILVIIAFCVKSRRPEWSRIYPLSWISPMLLTTRTILWYLPALLDQVGHCRPSERVGFILWEIGNYLSVLSREWHDKTYFRIITGCSAGGQRLKWNEYLEDGAVQRWTVVIWTRVVVGGSVERSQTLTVYSR